ncbi:MAG: Eco29kI family restriction endonuclease [Devosia sp.]|nr:Eco29kI family restriction endonuclease [Devosia sp.]
MTIGPYNPLDKLSLARSIEAEILSREIKPMDTTEIISGAGVYVIYYRGGFEPYSVLSEANKDDWNRPIYVGKAIPKGGRKGGIRRDAAARGTALGSRLRKHAESIRATSNLKIGDFVFRHIVLDDIWIPLGENILIETFKPLWNVAIEGFGINDPGAGRLKQMRSPWDVLHPGRGYADRLTGGGPDLEAVLGRVEDYCQGRPLKPLPKRLEEAAKIASEDDRGEVEG